MSKNLRSSRRALRVISATGAAALLSACTGYLGGSTNPRSTTTIRTVAVAKQASHSRFMDVSGS